MLRFIGIGNELNNIIIRGIVWEVDVVNVGGSWVINVLELIFMVIKGFWWGFFILSIVV